MLAQLTPYAFLAVFQVIGGLVAGDGLHKLLVDRLRGSFSLIVWGLFFGGIPMLLGTAQALRAGRPLLVAAQPALFVAALLFGLLLLPLLVQELGAGTLLTLTAGFVFSLVGGNTVLGILRGGSGGGVKGLVVGALFGAIGLWLCWLALSALIQGKSLDARSAASAPDAQH